MRTLNGIAIELKMILGAVVAAQHLHSTSGILSKLVVTVKIISVHMLTLEVTKYHVSVIL